jgi:Domain of unknown function (DUF1707)/Cell wall-active antibiotics response 4TMS YvqF
LGAVERSPELRVSDAEREHVALRLREAGGEGRLTLEELSERVELAYAARTVADLEALTTDLPAAGTAAAPAALPEPAPPEKAGWVVAVMSGADRRGSWRPRGRTRAVALMGAVDIDLREAQIDAPEIRITAVSVMGGVTVIVPEGVRVEMGGFALMGGNSSPRDPGPEGPGAPVVRVSAWSLMGAVDVKRRRRRRRDE